MMVRQAINDGLVLSRSSAIACATASGSCPSTPRTDQPEAAKRASWSSEVASEVGPSMEMPLSSNSTIRRPEMPGERDRFLADAFHQTAVAGNDVREMVDEAVAM